MFNISDSTLTSYFSNIIYHFYESTSLMIKQGEQWGFNVQNDYFRAISFQYPSDVVVNYDTQEKLQNLLVPVIDHIPFNRAISSNQFVLTRVSS